jgi:tripartite-type tricarboxylate transporter receptor subunit TctC
MIAALAVAAAAFCSTVSAADVQITRPIRFIVPYVPAGGRTRSPACSRLTSATEFGQQVIVDNRAGGSSTIGTQIVARAAPDGQTLGMIDAAFLVNPSLFDKLPYDTLKDFAPVVLIATAPLVLTVHPGVKAASVSELVALAKAQPGKLTFGSAGNGTAVHLAGEQLRSVAGINIVHVPYKGAGQSVIDVLGGQLTMVFMTQSGGKGHIASGRLRALAITSPKRTSVLPEVMTFAEAGYPRVDAVTINGVIAPAGTPREYIRRVNGVAMRALKNAEFQAKLQELGFEIAGGTPEQFDAWIRTEIGKWAKVVKESGAKAEL